MKRKTIGKEVRLSGLGVFSGKDINIKISPHDQGIIFSSQGQQVKLGENWKHSHRCSCVWNKKIEIKMTEHFLAAARIWGLTDAYIELDFPEFPILDGAGMKWFNAFERSGSKMLEGDLDFYTPKKPIIYEQEDILLCWKPSKKLTVKILYHHLDSRVPVYYEKFDMSKKEDINTVLTSKTFIFEEEIPKLITMGTINKNSQRVSDSVNIIKKEPTDLSIPAHKCLDLIGDMYLSGRMFSGEFLSVRGGHLANQKLLEKAFE